MAAHARRLVSTVVVVLAVGTGLSACSGHGAPTHRTAAACPTLLPEPSKKVPLSSIYVNVYNAGDHHDLASEVAVELKWRKIHIISVGNDPLSQDREPPKTAEIRFGKMGRQIALTLATQVKGATLYQDDRQNPSVDLVLGNHFALVPVPPPPPKQVAVNVYNTTFHAGWAAQVGSELRKRGFQVKAEGNDPQGRFWPDNTVVVMYGKQGEPAARRVALQFPDAKMKQLPHRSGTTVDLDLGNKFTSLVPVAKATPAPTPTRTQPSC